jgi:hypothetical protein
LRSGFSAVGETLGFRNHLTLVWIVDVVLLRVASFLVLRGDHLNFSTNLFFSRAAK